MGFSVVGLLSRHAKGYAMPALEKTAIRCAAKLVNDNIPRRGGPHALLIDRGAEFVAAANRSDDMIITAKREASNTGEIQRKT